VHPDVAARREAARQAGLSAEEFWLLEELAFGMWSCNTTVTVAVVQRLIFLGFARENPAGGHEITKEGLGVVAMARL
jgi:hypothetical protein